MTDKDGPKSYQDLALRYASKPPKIGIYDIETSLALMATFGLKVDYIPHENIIQDWYVICGCWKTLGEKKIHAVSVLDDPDRFAKSPIDDYHVVKTLRDMMAGYDILVHHNGDKFDVKKINARLIYHGLEPLPPLLTVDTLKEARRVAAFTSNRLDYLGKFLGLGGKDKTSGGLWLRVLSGCIKAIKEMVKYNKRDVDLLEKVYLKLLPYMKHPNVNRCGASCPKCGGHDIQLRGFATTRNGTVHQRTQCKKCGAWSKFRKSEAIKSVIV